MEVGKVARPLRREGATCQEVHPEEEKQQDKGPASDVAPLPCGGPTELGEGLWEALCVLVRLAAIPTPQALICTSDAEPLEAGAVRKAWGTRARLRPRLAEVLQLARRQRHLQHVTYKAMHEPGV